MTSTQEEIPTTSRKSSAIKESFVIYGFVCLILSVVTNMVGVITIVILMSEDIKDKTLILALAGFLCPFIMFIVLIIVAYYQVKDVIKNGILSLFYAVAVSLHIASLVLMIEEKPPRKKHKELVMTLISTGLTFEGLFFIVSIIINILV